MGSAVEVYEQDGATIAVDASIGPDAVMSAVRGQYEARRNPELGQFVAVLDAWASQQQPRQHGKKRRLGGMLDRDKFLAPATTFEQILMAREAIKDDVVGNAADITEAFALSAVGAFSKKFDQQDALNQWFGLVNMDELMRQLWRILLTDSQFVGVTWWDRYTFDVRGTGPGGARRRKSFNWVLPTAISTIDTTRVVPVGTLMFGQESLAYIADAAEADRFDAILDARDGRAPTNPARLEPLFAQTMMSNASSTGFDALDPIVQRIVKRRYKPSVGERQRLTDQGIPIENLFLLDPRFVFRHTLTRPDHQMFADVRMASLFPILDLKNNLRQMDRAFVIGGTNYIILITKGEKGDEATPAELANLRANATKIGQFPLLTGDHRLHVEIVTPKIDLSLDPKKWGVLDDRLYAASFGTFTAAGSDSGSADPLKLGRVIGTGLESKRRMLRRTLERKIFRIMVLSNPDMDPFKMVFSPDKISLAFDSAWATFMQYLLDSKHISRETALSQFGLDQSDEAALREREEEHYDHIFQSQVPFTSNNGQPADPAHQEPGHEQLTPAGQRALTAQAGRSQGGAAPGTGQGQESTNPMRSETGPRKKPKADDVLTMVAAGIPVDELEQLLLGGGGPKTAMARDDLKELAGHWNIKGRHQMTAAQLVAGITTAYDMELNDAD